MFRRRAYSKRKSVKAKLSHRYYKIVKSFESSDKGVCQNPELAVKLKKTFAPESFDSVSSAVGNTCNSLHIIT